ncbi:uncharacterized protein LOC129222932 [Uloborus diversus]|uniref:uncharacterized protein LOC129222932 n=1 Tax=Uloborus diversus TaxID=327109 RepID=UPI00240A0FC6|nr:uncharacterized protein LOC129222932 [Uloborus diversus]
MAGSILMAFITFAYAPGMFLGMLASTESASVVQVTSSNEFYSEAPCELHPLSAYKDIHGNLWGIGDGNLWWFNSTNLSWSLLPLPNGSASSEPWRVACADPRHYVAIVGKNATLVLHLPWQHWQLADTDDVSLGYVDKDATWCVFGFLFGVDPLRETLYLLDPTEAHWTVREDLPIQDNVNWSTPYGIVNTWVGYDGELILVERFGDYRRVMYTNSSGIHWVTLSEATSNNLWPDLDKEGRSLSWYLGGEKMWLWKNNSGKNELWSFNYNTTLWEEGDKRFVEKLPSFDSVLTAWEDDDSYCILKRSSECTAQYSISHVECWSEDDMVAHERRTHAPNIQERVLTDFVTGPMTEVENDVPHPNYTSTSHSILAPMTTKEIPPSPININSVKFKYEGGPLVVPVSGIGKVPIRSTESITLVGPGKSQVSVSVYPARDWAWHQHTSVFGSVIFFGTSLTIFGLVGFFWCVRKCVHFPKEALLLRDPPSVRYTAIPDSLGYDSRKPVPATYTVIPDSIA